MCDLAAYKPYPTLFRVLQPLRPRTPPLFPYTTLFRSLPRRGAGGFRRFIKDGDFQIEAKTALRGTLNKWNDEDKGWSVEGRIPWSGFARTGGRPEPNETWKFTLCRYDYSVDFEGPELSTCSPLNTKSHPDFHAFEGYATLKFLPPDKSPAADQAGAQPGALPPGLGAPLTTSTVVGSPDPPLPY